MSVNRDVLKPGSIDELTAAVRASASAGSSIRVRGGDTKRAFGNLVAAPDREIDMRGLAGVIDYSPVDLTIAVQPGITLAAIDELLASERQRLVVDAPNRSQSTVGGVFAAGLSGPRRIKYGSLKDLVLGVEIVTSSGDIAKAGGMVVKNVSGYEMARLHYGAHGAFGIVTRLNLRVQPMPDSRLELQVSYPDRADCFAAAGMLLTSNLDPAAVYATRSQDGAWVLHVQIEGSDSFVRAQTDKLAQAVRRAANPREIDTQPIDGPSTPDFDRVVDLAQAGELLVARSSVTASMQSDALGALARLEGAEFLADMGSGLIYTRCTASEEAVRALERAGSTSFLALPDEQKAGRDVFGPMDSGAAAVLRRVKQEFDPRGMFNPGHFALHL